MYLVVIIQILPIIYIFENKIGSERLPQQVTILKYYWNKGKFNLMDHNKSGKNQFNNIKIFYIICILHSITFLLGF